MGTLVVVEMPLTSGLPRDKVVNTFAVAEGNPATQAAKADNLAGCFERLYTVPVAPTPKSIDKWLSPAVSRAAGACAIKLYDITDHLDGSPHGSPYWVRNFTINGSDDLTHGVPEEVAVCVTLEAAHRSEQRVEVADGTDPDAAPDRPRQRYTGRFYFGPIIPAGVTIGAGGLTRPNANMLSDLRTATVRLAVEIDQLAGYVDQQGLGVWSRKSKWIRGIGNVRTDDAFDTQRRRGASPTVVTRVDSGELVPEVELAA